MDCVELAVIRSDYYSAIADYGFGHKTVREQTENESDRIFDEPYGLYLGESEIDGLGLFAKNEIRDGDLVAIARAGDKRTTTGRYTNHHPDPNSFFIEIDDCIWAVAKRSIKQDEEITVDYRQAISLGIERVVADDIKDISVFDTKRCYLTGVMAAAYDMFLSDDHIANLSLRDRIIALENVLMKYPQAEIKTEHEFIDGLYRRRITIPKGCIATGKIHPVDHMDVMLSGEMIIATDDGCKHIKGPLSMISIAGKKKAGYALSEVIWETYHPTDKKTVEEVEMEIFTDEYIEIDVDGGAK